jgi:hypothetical protein
MRLNALQASAIAGQYARHIVLSAFGRVDPRSNSNRKGAGQSRSVSSDEESAKSASMTAW